MWKEARSPIAFSVSCKANSAEELRQEIKRITGVEVREAAAEVETTTGTVVQVFTTGTMVQVFLLAQGVPAGSPASETPLLPAARMVR